MCAMGTQGISHRSKQPGRVSLQEHEAPCSHAPPSSCFRASRLESAFKSLFAEYLFNFIVTFHLILTSLLGFFCGVCFFVVFFFSFNPSLLLLAAIRSFLTRICIFHAYNQPVSISLLLKPFDCFLNLKMLDPPKVTLRQAGRSFDPSSVLLHMSSQY